MIIFEDVGKRYGEFQALEGVSLTIPSKSIFGIVGQSGAGKSTLLRTINRLEELETGNIIVDDTSVGKLDKKGLRDYRKNVGMIFQHFSLLETQTIYKNIALPLECSKYIDPDTLEKRKYSKLDIEKRVRELAAIVGLEDKLEEKPRNLSGGQKQRVAIARAIALNPKILLCDEATSALDPNTTQQILQLLKKINQDLGITIVIVTHQMEVVKEVCDEVAIMSQGKLVEVGKTDELFLSNNQALKSFVDDGEILPVTGVNIKIYFPKKVSKDNIITQMARKLDIDFSIVWGKLEKFKNDVLGSLIINVTKDNLKIVKEYLDKENVGYEVIE